MEIYEFIGNGAVIAAGLLVLVSLFLPSPSLSKAPIVMHAIATFLFFIAATCMTVAGDAARTALYCAIALVLFMLMRDGVMRNQFGVPIAFGDLLDLEDEDDECDSDEETVAEAEPQNN